MTRGDQARHPAFDTVGKFLNIGCRIEIGGNAEGQLVGVGQHGDARPELKPDRRNRQQVHHVSSHHPQRLTGPGHVCREGDNAALRQPTSARDLMFIESTMSTFDAMIAEHVMVAADPATTFQSARTLREYHCTPEISIMQTWIHARVQHRTEIGDR